jgi:hypothetical protein
MEQLFGLNIEQLQKASQLRFARRRLDVFDDVELDVVLAKDVRRAT